MQKSQRSHSVSALGQKQLITPQTNIYNRHYYLRGSEHELRQKQYQQQIKQLANKPKITPSSYQLLSSQLDENLKMLFNKHIPSHKDNSIYTSNSSSTIPSHPLDLPTLQSIFLEALNLEHLATLTEKQRERDQFAKKVDLFTSQIWMVLAQYELGGAVDSRVLYGVIRVLMDPYNLDVKECMQMLNMFPQWQSAPQNRISFLEKFSKSYPELEQQTLPLPQLLKLWKTIRYSNPLFTPGRPSPAPPSHPFKPSINKVSEKLAEKSLKKYIEGNRCGMNRTLESRTDRSGDLSKYLQEQQQTDGEKMMSYHEILYQRKLEKDRIQMKTLKEDESFCQKSYRTAKPDQIRQIVNNLYVLKPRRQDINFAQRDQQEQLKHCTFSPRINKKYSRSSLSPAPKGYEKELLRMQKGRENREKKKQAFENLGKVKGQGDKKEGKSRAFSFLDRDAPRLILEINIDGDRIQKLYLRGNQNPHLVAKKFVHKYGLEQPMVEVLQSLVEEQLANL